MTTHEDEIRLAFLRDLDDADHINLTDWEAEFVGNNAYTTFNNFTEKQRISIDKLRKKYESRI